MMHKTCSINYRHLADLQKTLPTTDLNKKNLSFDKISPRDFYFFSLSFQSVLVSCFQRALIPKGISCDFAIMYLIHQPQKMAVVRWTDSWKAHNGTESQMAWQMGSCMRYLKGNSVGSLQDWPLEGRTTFIHHSKAQFSGNLVPQKRPFKLSNHFWYSV